MKMKLLAHKIILGLTDIKFLLHTTGWLLAHCNVVLDVPNFVMRSDVHGSLTGYRFA